MIISAAMIYIAAVLPMSWFDREYLFILMWGLVLPGSCSAIIWVISLFQILFNKFKVPISIDEELVRESLDPELVEDILKTVKTKGETEKNSKKKNKEENSKINEKDDKVSKVLEENETLKEKKKSKKIKVVCASCGATVRVKEGETICPKCDEPLNGN